MAGGRTLDCSILREYDIRGIVGDTLLLEDVCELGKGFGSIVVNEYGAMAQIAVGYDGRHSSPPLVGALIEGLSSTGVGVINVGMGPTPMLYFATHETNSQAGMMITGSHNPPNFNGIKMMLGQKSFYGKAIQSLGIKVKNGDFVTGVGTVEETDIRDQYVNRLLQGNECLGSMKVVWDPGNGASGEVIRKLIGQLDGEHILINGEIDGSFPNHHPDPTVESNLDQLKKAVSENACDLGIGFDGDGDRIGIIDSQERVLWGDQLLIILARDVLTRLPGSKIIADVKTSSVFYEQVAKAGGHPIMWKTGHSLIKAKMAELNAPLAGEMSGHIFFADEYYGFDDAIYAALRLLRILACSGQKLDDIRDSLPAKFNTPEIRIDCADDQKFVVMDKVVDRLRVDGTFNVCDIDGVRVETEEGWWLLRASNTQPVLVARCESSTKKGLSRLKGVIREQLRLSGIKSPDLG